VECKRGASRRRARSEAEPTEAPEPERER